ncbi:MAG: SDR family NAD(P)-dependent oxidoreductase [Actinomycetota bacterium]|nr:SDR family oxidoreductase [Actinomycetota bacterium]
MTSVDDSEVPPYPKLVRLDGRGFIVIGAGQGIGRQASHALASCGAHLFCIDNQESLAKEIADEVGGIPWTGDARDRGDVEEAVSEAKKALGRIDGLVDIVGMAKYMDILSTSDEDWDWTFGVVLRHAFLFSQLAGRAMADGGGGVMCFVASVSGISSAPRHAAYGAAKAGLMSWVRSLAVELGPSGVRTNAVAPGVVWTPRVSGYLGERGRKLQSDNAPLRRVALPADIASAILFLCSDLSSYVNGQTLVVDGGVGAKFPYPMDL